jgi:nucleoside-diphosphate-sugar epimerase
VIHTAFNHDFSKFKANCEVDRGVILAVGAALANSNKPLIVTSGIGTLPPGGIVTEAISPVFGPKGHPRAVSEEAANLIAAGGVNVSVVRLPPSVHGVGDHGFVPTLIEIARKTGVSVYEGDGLNRWPAVHRLDAAILYRLALEKSLAAGTRLHAVAEKGVAFRQIAETIGKHLALPVQSQSPEEAAQHFGWFAHFAAMNITASSASTQQLLGWKPKQLGLVADLDQESYFRAE